MKEKSILIIGGNGVLGKEISKICRSRNIKHFALDKKSCNILSRENIRNSIQKYNPDILIHAAGLISLLKCEESPSTAIDINITGTVNIVQECINTKIKLVYISSDSVFSGDKGKYSISDRLDPISVYGKTKSASEYIVSLIPNHQILRAPFLREVHPKVFKNQYCSRYLKHQVAEKIIDNIMFNSNKIVHISTHRRLLSDLYEEMGVDFELIPIPENLKNLIAKDASLINTSIY